jgi:hypothetical protein
MEYYDLLACNSLYTLSFKFKTIFPKTIRLYLILGYNNVLLFEI